MDDFFGRPLAIGDTVAFIENRYRSYRRGELVTLTAQKVRIRYRNGFKHNPISETLRFPGEVIRE